ncbi:DMT family transporter [Leptobacterium sp. I13]|uniref:DMT family transporter n=1 Tax=Leptobacterium meishanense TaxID=3128904 RepID=UPI0030ECD123
MLNDKLKNYLSLHLIVFIWGFTAVLGALISINAIALVWYRILLSLPFIFVFICIKKIPLVVPKKTFFGFIFGGIIIALHWITFFGAIKVANVSVTLAMMSTGTFFAAIMEPIWYKRKMLWYELIFGLIVIVGLFIIFKVEASYTEGIVLALISAFLSAVFALLNGKFVHLYKPSVITFYELVSGVFFISIYLVFSGNFSKVFFYLQTMDWIYLLILSSICTAYAFIISVKVMRYVSPYTVMLTINLEPVYGILLAYFILGDSESMSKGFYIGAIVILMTVIANGIIKNYKRRKGKNHLSSTV